MKWHRVNREHPCVRCGRPDWCGYTDDGTVHCMRIESDKPSKSGGWIHRTEATGLRKVWREFRKPKFPPVYWHKLAVDCQNDLGMKGLIISALLGVSSESLDRLLAGWHFPSCGFSFPMFDGGGKMCGIRLRLSNRKICVKHSANGLFWPTNLAGEGTLWIVEGETDTAAMLDLGFEAIGRPNCCGGVKEIQRMLRKYPREKVVIMADNDEPKERPDGTLWRPGETGAIVLAEAISSIVGDVRVVKPPFHKDVRAWYNDGCSKSDVLGLL